MNRRAFIAAPAALATMPAAASALDTQRPAHAPDAIRERIALVVETFARATVAFPDPMTPQEAAAALAMTDADIEALDAPLAFAARWGVSLDWLLLGDVKALIFNARRGIDVGRRASADPLPSMVAEWETLETATQTESRTQGVDFNEAPSFARYAAVEEQIAETEPNSIAGVAAQLWAAARIMDFTNRDASTNERMLAASLRAAKRLAMS